MNKHLLLFLIALLPVLSFAQKAEPKTQLRHCTFNIRLLNEGDRKIDGCHWDDRKERVARFVKLNNIDIVGMQEVLNPQLKDLQKMLPDYDYVGVGRTDGKTKGEYSPIFYRKSRFQTLDKGNFWLSEKPEAVGKKGWDAAIERIASWAKLRDRKTGQVFMVVNTHFDHVGVVARKESAKLIMRKIQEIVGNNPAVVTGDFNITEQDDAYSTMVTNDFKMLDAFHATKEHHGNTYTFHDFCRIPSDKADKIDYIFVTPNIAVLRTCIPFEEKAYQLSDHNPHWADLEF